METIDSYLKPYSSEEISDDLQSGATARASSAEATLRKVFSDAREAQDTILQQFEASRLKRLYAD